MPSKWSLEIFRQRSLPCGGRLSGKAGAYVQHNVPPFHLKRRHPRDSHLEWTAVSGQLPCFRWGSQSQSDTGEDPPPKLSSEVPVAYCVVEERTIASNRPACRPVLLGRPAPSPGKVEGGPDANPTARMTGEQLFPGYHDEETLPGRGGGHQVGNGWETRVSDRGDSLLSVWLHRAQVF